MLIKFYKANGLFVIYPYALKESNIIPLHRKEFVQVILVTIEQVAFAKAF